MMQWTIFLDGQTVNSINFNLIHSAGLWSKHQDWLPLEKQSLYVSLINPHCFLKKLKTSQGLCLIVPLLLENTKYKGLDLVFAREDKTFHRLLAASTSLCASLYIPQDFTFFIAIHWKRQYILPTPKNIIN